MARPRLLDLFCGAGGCAMGDHRAGFEVVGVDIAPQPRYPFGFTQMDALEYLARYGFAFDVVHASPPCQGYSRMNRAVRAEHPRLIPVVRERLQAQLARGGPRAYVIENVEGSELRNPVMLCGTMFGLRVRRHRLFEVWPPPLCLLPDCSCRNGVVSGRLVGHRVAGKVATGRRQPPRRTEADRRTALGCEWMSTMEARQAIPPAYTEYLGRRLREVLEA